MARKLQQKCPSCGKVAVELSRTEFPGIGGEKKLFIRLDCGHLMITAGAVHSSEQIVSLDGRKPYPFQEKGIEFLEDSNFRALIADEMGLGKTIQASVPLKLHEEQLIPCVWVCKSGLRYQTMTEHVRWCGKEFVPYIMQAGNDELIPGFKIYIVSYDLLRRKGVLARLHNLNPKCVVLDEVQHIKNPDSQRTGAVRELVRMVPHVIALSGTPIKNRASEYFTILNILNPTMFPSFNSFMYHHVNYYYDGYKEKEAGLKNPARFRELTKDFVIRRTRDEVLPELPKIDRKFFHVDLEEHAKKAYNEEMEGFAKVYDQYVIDGMENSFEAHQNLLARLARMRHIAGLSAVPAMIEYIQDFLSSTDRKLAVFVHHKDVGELIKMAMNTWCEANGLDPVIAITSDMTPEARHDAQQKFKEPGKFRLLIGSTLASGEGLNLQYQCSDCLIVERQWNPANEEQVEARFMRPDAISKDYVSAVYGIVSNTIVEWFSELVEKKRVIFGQVMDGTSKSWQESELMKELFDIIAKKGRKKTYTPLNA